MPRVSRFIDIRDTSSARSAACEGGQEHHFTEAAVMIAFAIHLLNNGASAVQLHPDGQHVKRHDLKGTLEHFGFRHVSMSGTTAYAGLYTRNEQIITITPRPGLGDVVATVHGTVIVAECKGGVVNSSYGGQQSKLRRSLYEAVGLLLTRPATGERQIAVVPATDLSLSIARRLLPRASAAGIEIALVEADGEVLFVEPEGGQEQP